MKVALVFFILFGVFILNISSETETSHFIHILQDNVFVSNDNGTFIPMKGKREEYLWFCVEIHVQKGVFKIEKADMLLGKWIKEPGEYIQDVGSPEGEALAKYHGRKLICSYEKDGSPSGIRVRLRITSSNLRKPWIVSWDRSYRKISTFGWEENDLIKWEDYDRDKMEVHHVKHVDYWHKFFIRKLNPRTLFNFQIESYDNE